jgi:MutS domain V
LPDLDRTHLWLSNGRLLLATVGAILLWQSVIRHSASGWWPVAAGLAFGALAVVHARALNRMERARRAERVYLRALDRLNDRWAGAGREGAAFLGDHLYARDLDLFGRASLFELLNTARTEIGEATLADWLRAPAPPDEVRARQASVEELRSQLDLREDLSVLAAESDVSRTGALAGWASTPPTHFSTALQAALAFSTLVTIALFAMAYEGMFPTGVAGAWVLLLLGAVFFARHSFERVLHGVEMPDHDLGPLSEVLARLERERFSTPRLQALHAALVTDGVPPSRRIAQLRSLVSWLDATHNLLFAPIAFVLLMRQQLAIAIGRWHERYGSAVTAWLRAVGEAEALSALATFAYEHPDDPFPELANEGAVFDAEALAHPLIPAAVAIANDVRLGGSSPSVIIVSGSNMSGKSTLLRSVGVNVVLALAGATVRAKRLRLSPLVLGATLKIEDSLEAGHSRFYSEILRIRAIVDAGRGPIPLLFLLDEILHGTNSHDRRIGAEAIVTALVNLGAIGLVTTHDLALTQVTATLGDRATNVHFEDRLVDGKMVFNYRMQPGVVEHSNALELMRTVGLNV